MRLWIPIIALFFTSCGQVHTPSPYVDCSQPPDPTLVVRFDYLTCRVPTPTPTRPPR